MQFLRIWRIGQRVSSEVDFGCMFLRYLYVHYRISLQYFKPIPIRMLGTVDNRGNTEITETVIFVNAVNAVNLPKCRVFAKMP